MMRRLRRRRRREYETAYYCGLSTLELLEFWWIKRRTAKLVKTDEYKAMRDHYAREQAARQRQPVLMDAS